MSGGGAYVLGATPVALDEDHGIPDDANYQWSDVDLAIDAPCNCPCCVRCSKSIAVRRIYRLPAHKACVWCSNNHKGGCEPIPREYQGRVNRVQELADVHFHTIGDGDSYETEEDHEAEVQRTARVLFLAARTLNRQWRSREVTAKRFGDVLGTPLHAPRSTQDFMAIANTDRRTELGVGAGATPGSRLGGSLAYPEAYAARENAHPDRFILNEAANPLERTPKRSAMGKDQITTGNASPRDRAKSALKQKGRALKKKKNRRDNPFVRTADSSPSDASPRKDKDREVTFQGRAWRGPRQTAGVQKSPNKPRKGTKRAIKPLSVRQRAALQKQLDDDDDLIARQIEEDVSDEEYSPVAISSDESEDPVSESEEEEEPDQEYLMSGGLGNREATDGGVELVERRTKRKSRKDAGRRVSGGTPRPFVEVVADTEEHESRVSPLARRNDRSKAPEPATPVAPLQLATPASPLTAARVLGFAAQAASAGVAIYSALRK